MKKIICLLLIASVIFVISGCGQGQDTETDRPYDLTFESAKEWTEYWCGPCEQIDVRSEDLDHSDYYDYAEYYTMKDSELGFTYTVNAYYRNYGSGFNKPVPDYSCYDFDKPYMQAFIEATDFSAVTEKYDLVIDINDGSDGYYPAMIDLETERELTAEDAGEILDFVYYSLEGFDQRKHFTKNEYCTSVGVNLFCAPDEERREAGALHNSWRRTYGYVAE